MKIRNRLNAAFILVVLASLSVSGAAILALTRDGVARRIDRELSDTSLLVYKIVKNVYDLNEKALRMNMRSFSRLVKSVRLDPSRPVVAEAEHHVTRLTDTDMIPTLEINGRPAFGSTAEVDAIAELSGGNVSVFQLAPRGLLRVATSVARPDGARAVGMYYPEDHEITQAIRAGKPFVGKSFESDQWCIASYEPIFDGAEVVGALHVGIRPDIDDMRRHVLDVVIGKSGGPFIVDTEGILVIDRIAEGENVYHLPHVKAMIRGGAEGSVSFASPPESSRPGKASVIHYRSLPEMGWIVASAAYLDEFYGDVDAITRIIVVSLFAAFAAAVLVALRISSRVAGPINELTSTMTEAARADGPAALEAARSGMSEARAGDEETRSMALAFSGMLGDLADAQRQLLSKHRRFREAEISRRARAALEADVALVRGADDVETPSACDRVEGNLWDSCRGPDGQTWYAIGEARTPDRESGTAMMAAQSCLNASLKSLPDASPGELAAMVNAYLVDRLRGRGLDAVSIAVTSPDGTVRYAGREREVWAWREAEGLMERIETAASPSGSRTARLRLSPGDAFMPRLPARGKGQSPAEGGGFSIRREASAPRRKTG